MKPVRRNSPLIMDPIIRAAPFTGLQGDVARESVADHDVRLAAEDPVPFHEPDVVEVAPGDELGRLPDPFMPLDLLFPDVEKTDSRSGEVVDGAHQRRPHDRELEEVFRSGVDVRPEIEHVGMSSSRRQGGDDRRPVDAGQRLQDETRDGEQGSRVPRTHAGIGFAARYEVEGDPHGRVPFRPQRLGRRLVHLDLLAGVVDAHSFRALPAAELGLDALGVSDENGLEAINPSDGGEGGRHHDGRAVVTAHRVERDGDRLHPGRFVRGLLVLAGNHLPAS